MCMVWKWCGSYKVWKIYEISEEDEAVTTYHLKCPKNLRSRAQDAYLLFQVNIRILRSRNITKKNEIDNDVYNILCITRLKVQKVSKYIKYSISNN